MEGEDMMSKASHEIFVVDSNKYLFYVNIHKHIDCWVDNH